MRQHVARVGRGRGIEGGGNGHRRWRRVTGVGGQSCRVKGWRGCCHWRHHWAAVGTAIRAAPGRRTGCCGRLVPRRAGGWVAQRGGFVRQEVVGDVWVGSEWRVKGARIEGALGTVGTAEAGRNRPAGRRRRGGGATQDGEYAVLPLGRCWCGRGHGGGRGRLQRRAGRFWESLRFARLLLLDLEERLSC